MQKRKLETYMYKIYQSNVIKILLYDWIILLFNHIIIINYYYYNQLLLLNNIVIIIIVQKKYSNVTEPIKFSDKYAKYATTLVQLFQISMQNMWQC